MNRDIRRVHDYYQTLIHEHRQVLAKKLTARDENERADSKIEAVERELKGKVQDVIGKFSIDLLLEPISFIRIETISPMFWLSVKRRKEARPFPLTYNPVSKSPRSASLRSLLLPEKRLLRLRRSPPYSLPRMFRSLPPVRQDLLQRTSSKGCPRCLS